MSQRDETNGDLPVQAKWIMTFINRIGFPILVCIWLAYQQFSQGRELVRALNDFRDILSSLKVSVDQQNKILRHNGRYDD